MVSRFYEQFSRNRRNLGHFRKFEKISNSQNTNILYIILKHVVWRFQIYNLFREIFKFREDKSNNVFREIRKCFRITAKFEFFAKQIIYLESPDHKVAKSKYFSKIIGGGGGTPHRRILLFCKYVYTILKHVVWRFRIYNYFREIFKIPATQTTCFKMMYNMFIFLKFEIFSNSRSGAIAEPFRENCL